MLHNEQFRASYGSLYSKVEIYKHAEALKFTFYFCVRRMINATIIAFLQSSIVFQVLVLVQVALVMTTWAIKTKPMIDTASNLVFITNELLILLSSYLVLLFSGYVPSVEQKYQFGFMFISIFLIESAFNLLVFIYSTGKDMIKSWRLAKARKLYTIKRQAIKLQPNETPVDF